MAYFRESGLACPGGYSDGVGDVDDDDRVDD